MHMLNAFKVEQENSKLKVLSNGAIFDIVYSLFNPYNIQDNSWSTIKILTFLLLHTNLI
jgi:hypothetical protein